MRLVLVLLAALGLGACGDDEPKQRTAFIQFLQERIVGKPGVHVPKLTAEQTAAFGDYAKHYAVIADFNAALDSEVGKPMQRAIEAGAPHSLEDLPGRRNDIAAAHEDSPRYAPRSTANSPPPMRRMPP